MSPAVWTYLLGMAALVVGQRLAGGEGALGNGATALGALLIFSAAALRARMIGASVNDSQRHAHRKALGLTLAGVASVVVYALSTETFASGLGLSEEGLKRFTVSLSAVWPILWLAATAPLILVDLAIQDTPKLVQPVRIRQAIDNGLIAALGLALVFPLNYLATQHNKRWDFAYFKTTSPGDSTRAIVESLSEPVVVRVFLPTASEVAAEVMPYFQSIAGGNLTVELVDHAAEPELAKRLKVRDNGNIAITLKDGQEGETTKSWKLGADMDAAKRNLRKLDEEFRKKLLEIVKAKSNVYFTVGHDELSWKGGELPDDKLTGLRELLGLINLTPKELGLAEGLGVEVPEDAGVVFIVGPKEPFMPEEIASLTAFMDRGGALFIALEPDGEPLNELLAPLGLKRAEGRLATEQVVLRRSGDKLDRINLVSNRYSSHDSSTTLSRNAKQLPLFMSGVGALDEVPGGKGKVTVTVRSLEETWADLDGDLELTATAGESKSSRSIAAAVSGAATAAEPVAGEEKAAEFRALVIADATAVADLTLTNKANQVLVVDSVAWLLGEAALGGSVENEEDVKIEHTQEDQSLWFYSTIVAVPAIVVLLGLLRVRMRRAKGGVA
ncbi:MAG: Gldg family protein [Deltaproteobacteria bacterium]|nr:Gldg family protein [Deltaproteobacteria bacterium]